MAGIQSIQDANRFLRDRYRAEFNRLFAKPAREKATAFRKCTRKDLDEVFSIQTERTIAKDNTVAIRDRFWQLNKTPFRRTVAGCTVTICEHLDDTVTVRWGPHTLGRFDAEGRPLNAKPKQSNKKTARPPVSGKAATAKLKTRAAGAL